jgi:hypothetical protein
LQLRNLSSSMRRTFVLGLVLACLASCRAYGDVGVVLNESLDTSIARITGSGHTAVYLSRICPESPVRLRLCRADEQGSVISNYITLGEDQPFEWNAVPLSVYVYGVENPQYRPLVGSQKIKHVLEERYREKYLSAYCGSEFCRTSNKAEWREMVGASLSRSIYMFVAETTVEQDLDLIAQFNSLPNKNHFNGVTRNCADFARRVINTYFPHATGPDYINDFGMTSPKAIARSFTRYAIRHPEAHFRVVHYAQIPGTIKRSSECRAGTEQLYRSKKLLVPMLIFANQALPFVAASYLFTGRFNPQRELEKHPSVEATEVEYQIQPGNSGNSRTGEPNASGSQGSAEVVGTSEDWKEYRSTFDSLVTAAVREEIIRDRGDLKGFFQRLDEAGTPVADPDGALWIELSKLEGNPKVGLSASNILDSASDSQLAYELLLTRTERVLNSPKHSRETMVEFKQDWDLLQHGDFYSARSVLRAAAGPGVGARSFTGK